MSIFDSIFGEVGIDGLLAESVEVGKALDESGILFALVVDE